MIKCSYLFSQFAQNFVQEYSVNSNANFEKHNVVKRGLSFFGELFDASDDVIIKEILPIFTATFTGDNPNKLKPRTDPNGARFTVDGKAFSKTFNINVPVMYIYKVNNCWDGTKVGSWQITYCAITAKISRVSAIITTVYKPSLKPKISYQCHGSEEFVGNTEIERACAHGKDSSTNKNDTTDCDDGDNHVIVSTTNNIDTIDCDDENSQGEDFTTKKIDTVDRDGESNRNKFSRTETIDFKSTIISTFVNITLRQIAEQNPNRDLPVVDESDFKSAIVHEDNLSRKLYMINVTIRYRETVCPDRIEPQCSCIIEIKNCKITGLQNICKLNVDPLVSFQCYDSRDRNYLIKKEYHHAKCVVDYMENEMKTQSDKNYETHQSKKITHISGIVEKTSTKPNDKSKAIICLENKLKKIADKNPELNISPVVEGKIN